MTDESFSTARGLDSGLLPVLLAFVRDETLAGIDGLSHPDVTWAVDAGLGPILSAVTAEGASLPAPLVNEIKAADLTAKVIWGEVSDVIEDLASLGPAAGCDPVLLKGGAAALQYYPQPHLRTMVDLDLLLPQEQHSVLGRLLSTMGFAQRSNRPQFYARHHHSEPFWHPVRRVWIEVHGGGFPRRSPMFGDRRLHELCITSTSRVSIGAGAIRVMSDELQLVYGSIRWAEMLNPHRGFFPLLDAALLLKTRGGRLDWDRVFSFVEGTWASSALHLTLACLDAWRLANVPTTVLGRLRTQEQYLGHLPMRLLRRLVETCVLEARPPGMLLTSQTRRSLWYALCRPNPPWTKAFSVPWCIVSPPLRDDP